MTASGLSGCHREFVWDAPTGACCRAHLQLSEEPNSVLQMSTAGAKRVHDRVLLPRERGSSRAPIPTVPTYSVGGRLNQNSAVPLTTGTRRPGPYTFHQALCVTPGSLLANVSHWSPEDTMARHTTCCHMGTIAARLLAAPGCRCRHYGSVGVANRGLANRCALQRVGRPRGIWPCSTQGNRKHGART